MKLKNSISHYVLVSSRANNSDAPRLKLRTNSCHSWLRDDGVRPGNGIMNRKVESKLTSSICIGRHSCYAWPSRDPRSKCYAWYACENSILCIPCIRGGRLKISAINYTTAAHAFVKATLRLGLRAPFVARNKTTTTEKPTWNRQEQWPVNAADLLNQRIANPFVSADRCFGTKVKCPTGRASF